jgi:hypothetical protein
MPRTTVDIDAPILRELRKLQKRQGRSLGKLVSQLLAEALARREAPPEPAKLQWTSRPMDALVNLADKEALHSALDQKD